MTQRSLAAISAVAGSVLILYRRTAHGLATLFDNAKRLRALLAELQELTLAIIKASENYEQ